MAYNSQKNIMVNSIGELLGDIFIGDIFQKAIVIYHENLIFSELHEFKECLKNKENAADECGIGKARLLVIPCVLTCVEDERPFVLATGAFVFLICTFSCPLI